MTSIRAFLLLIAFAPFLFLACGDDGSTPDVGGQKDLGSQVDGTTDTRSLADTRSSADRGLAADSGRVADSKADRATTNYSKELVSVEKAKQLMAAGNITVVDVREPAELRASGCIAGSINLPYNSKVFEAKVNTLPKDKGVLIYCRSGARSSNASRIAVQAGYQPVYDLQGGITAWIGALEPTNTTQCGL